MQVPWFLATTPVPRRPAAPLRRKAVRRWWERFGDRLAAWGEHAHHHRLGSWMRR